MGASNSTPDFKATKPRPIIKVGDGVKLTPRSKDARRIPFAKQSWYRPNFTANEQVEDYLVSGRACTCN